MKVAMASEPRINTSLTARDTAKFLSFCGGAFAGAMLFGSHGWLAAVAGAAGMGLGVLFCFVFGRVLGLIYWEVLTGRRKLPKTRDGTPAQRKRTVKFLAAIFIVSSAIWAGLYFRAADAERARVVRLAELCFGACLVLVIALLTVWRWHPARGKTTMAKELQEFSTNLDSEMVRQFLERIVPFIDWGFGSDEVEQVARLWRRCRTMRSARLSLRFDMQARRPSLRFMFSWMMWIRRTFISLGREG
jgi:hypothetical protein